MEAVAIEAGAQARGEGSSGFSRNFWWMYLGVMAVLTSGYALGQFSGPEWLKSGLVFNMIGGETIAALIIGARCNSGRSRTPWYLFAVGQGLFVSSDVLASNYERLFGTALPFPSVADAFHLAFYPFLVTGMLLLIRQRDDGRDRDGLIDALIVTVALATLLWVYLIAPYADAQSAPLLSSLTSVAYPVMDILVLGVVARVAAGSHRREPAFVFLLSGAVVLLLSDAVHGVNLLDGGYDTAGILDTGWAIYFTLLGTSALHPSMSQLSEPGPEPDGRLNRARLALLSCASFTAPLLIVARVASDDHLDLYVLVGASALMFALVLLRMAGIVRRNEEATRREAALRLAGEALVSAATREDVYASTLQAAHSVVEEDVTVCLYIVGEDPDKLCAVGVSDGRDPSQVAPLNLRELPDDARVRASGNRVLALEAEGEKLCLSPLFVRDRLTGMLAVRAAQTLPRAAQESLATLATEVALALQTVALTEETVHQRSEDRLSALIKNSSDVICIVGEDMVVNYVSPSIERTFGFGPEDMIGHALDEMVDHEEVQRLLAYFQVVAAQPVGERATAEFRVRHASKRWRDVEVLGTNLLGEETIAGIVLNIRDISERKAFQAELEHQAFHDTLTGLPNRALFRNRVEHALLAQRRDRLPSAVLFLDLDDFKNVNDSLGHAAGDEVLQELGRRLEDCMRPVDTAARLGGDEFAILIHDADTEEHAVEIAHRVMVALEAPVALEDREVLIATSIGIAFSNQNMISIHDAEELLRNADAAMYIAKEAGKGQYQIFQPEMHIRALARLELKTDLQRALETGEFTLRYQPIMDLARGDMAGMEALVRWEHPVRGTVLPLDFVELLEDTGLIVAVGRYVMHEACAAAAHLQRECPRDPPLSMAVNVSACQLQRPEFVEEVRGALNASHIDPSTLTLELTESVMMEDLDLSLLRLNGLRALGVKLAIDDFGTGYSSLNYIRQFPVDVLKIDRSFLADPSPDMAQLTAAIVALARIFRLKVVAEGIENTTQLELLTQMKCDFGQGFHFARPLRREEVLEMARAQPGQRGHTPALRLIRATG
jgi:diguanylate cyclase (GGDEF)-like protein/PAS domain S-box-containing protein